MRRVILVISILMVMTGMSGVSYFTGYDTGYSDGLYSSIHSYQDWVYTPDPCDNVAIDIEIESSEY